MKLVSFNIQYGVGQDGVYNLDRTIASLGGADIIMLQEVERHWERTNFDDQIALIAGAFPDYFWAYGAHYDMDASYLDDASRFVQRRRQHGDMILSRVPLISVRTLALPDTAVLSPHFNMHRGLQEALIEWQGRFIRLYNTHLNHLCPELQAPQIKAIMGFIHDAKKSGLAWSGDFPSDPNWMEGGKLTVPDDVILTGDMNFCYCDPGYSDFTGPISRDYGRIYTEKHLMDSWTVTGHSEDAGDSCPPFGRLDYCFVSPSLRNSVTNSWLDENNIASDHYPYWVELDLSV